MRLATVELADGGSPWKGWPRGAALYQKTPEAPGGEGAMFAPLVPVPSQAMCKPSSNPSFKPSGHVRFPVAVAAFLAAALAATGCAGSASRAAAFRTGKASTRATA